MKTMLDNDPATIPMWAYKIAMDNFEEISEYCSKNGINYSDFFRSRLSPNAQTSQKDCKAPKKRTYIKMDDKPSSEVLERLKANAKRYAGIAQSIIWMVNENNRRYQTTRTQLGEFYGVAPNTLHAILKKLRDWGAIKVDENRDGIVLSTIPGDKVIIDETLFR